MRLLIDNFRLWWQVPRRAGDRIEHRQVSFLELFNDLVYVVLIAQFSHNLSSDLSIVGLGKFVFLFIIVWWSWINGTLYHDLHSNNDMRTRVFTFLQMFTVISMAIFAHSAIGTGSIGFALSYAAFQIIMTILWWRSGVHDPEHRPLARPYVIMFLVNVVLFIGSVFVSEPLRYYIWMIAIFIALVMPLMPLYLARNNDSIRKQMETASIGSSSIVERFGLFTIIVLGEVIVGIVSGISGHHQFSINLGFLALFGTLIAIGIWWLYFDFISHRLPRKGVMSNYWYYLHLPIVMGISVIGASLLNIIEYSDTLATQAAQNMLVGSVALILFCITALLQTIQMKKEHLIFAKRGALAMIFVAIIIIGLGFLELSSITLVISIASLLLFPVFVAFLTWVSRIKDLSEEAN